MNKALKISIAAASLVGGFALTAGLYAEEPGAPQDSHGSMTGPGMMGGGMMNMMQDTSQMGEMMEQCSQMMNAGMDSDSGRPNEQWRKNAPTGPDDSNAGSSHSDGD